MPVNNYSILTLEKVRLKLAQPITTVNYYGIFTTLALGVNYTNIYACHLLSLKNKLACFENTTFNNLLLFKWVFTNMALLRHLWTSRIILRSSYTLTINIKRQNRLLKVCYVLATSAGLPRLLFLLRPLTVLIRQTRQEVCTINQSVLLKCLWHWQSFFGKNVSNSDRLCTCPGHLGWHNTDRIICVSL